MDGSWVSTNDIPRVRDEDDQRGRRDEEDLRRRPLVSHVMTTVKMRYGHRTRFTKSSTKSSSYLGRDSTGKGPRDCDSPIARPSGMFPRPPRLNLQGFSSRS
ncbi:hypothetical protein H6P81_007632 [Aristolochia fimbriata]|uniref:Uncharacterized protein n=1 Tax=Aristolochia fimbriata TaxID=158543 RepID=A0AAV7F5B0_ARIFI|nr:hypothetical protein H6P81_007632 [Aristolochia fimbriata]